MRRILLSTTALVAAGLLVTSVAYADEEAMAEEEMAMEDEMMEPESVSLGISGFAYSAFGASTDADSPHMYENVDVNLSGSMTADNGMKFSVASKLRDAAEQIITVEGAFGTVNLGQAKSARAGSRIASSGATGTFGVNGPWQGGIASVVGTDGNSVGAVRDSKIVYTSPPIAGATLAASYAPGGQDNDGAISASDQLSAALTITQGLGDTKVSVNAGFETASMGTESPTDINAGASIVMGDIQLSGGMWEADDGAMQMDIGASMSMGALTVSAGWGNTETTNMYALGASYPLGEGVALDMQLDFGDRPDTDDDGMAQDSEWVQFMAGVAISY